MPGAVPNTYHEAPTGSAHSHHPFQALRMDAPGEGYEIYRAEQLIAYLRIYPELRVGQLKYFACMIMICAQLSPEERIDCELFHVALSPRRRWTADATVGSSQGHFDGAVYRGLQDFASAS